MHKIWKLWYHFSVKVNTNQNSARKSHVVTFVSFSSVEELSEDNYSDETTDEKIT